SRHRGRLAQRLERLLYTQDVGGSNPSSPIYARLRATASAACAAPRDQMAGMAKTYGDDLAYIHDTGFGDLARNAAPFLVDVLRRRGVQKGLVIDLGCGSGLLARGLSESGYDVLGIDISAAMIALARERVPDGRFLLDSLLIAELPTCVAVAAVGEGL